jgi:hypothetical protein
MFFKTKYDWLHILLLAVTIFLCLFASNVMLIMGYFIGSLLMIALLCFICYICLSVSITLNADHLMIRSSILRKKIPYGDIKEINVCKNFIASYAMSFKRIGIRINDKKGAFSYTYISPKEQEKFIEEIKKYVSEECIIKL